jgi:hypothetical protein
MAIQEAFPTLTVYCISTLGQLNRLANPSPISYLGGSTTHLRLLWRLNGISYPTLRKRLLSAGYSLSRFYCDLPHSGTFYPRQRSLPCLRCLDPKRFLKCDPFVRLPEWKSRRPLPLTHSSLPVIISFQGATSEYSMGLMAKIDAPLFLDVTIRCFHPLVFSIPQPAPLFSRTTNVRSVSSSTCGPLQSPCQVHTFLDQHGHFPIEHSRRKDLTRRVRTAGCKPAPETKVALSTLVQVCASSCLPFVLDASLLLSHLPGSISVITSAMRLS